MVNTGYQLKGYVNLKNGSMYKTSAQSTTPSTHLLVNEFARRLLAIASQQILEPPPLMPVMAAIA